MKDFHSILGVTPNSSNADIKSAYRRLARKFHPDVNPSGAQMFKEISQAYETLSDVQKRFQYDTIHGFFKTNQTPPPKNEQKSEPNYAKENYSKKSSESKKEHKFSAQSDAQKKNKQEFSKKINDIFEEFGKKTKPVPKRGNDIFEEITISIKEALNGAERTVNVVHSSQCPHCKGRKFINGAICSVCNGTGEHSEYKKIIVKIPKNVKNGTKLRLTNEGQSGENGGKNGDLYIKIKVASSSKIQFEGNDIIYNIPITPFEAVLGANISIPAFDGNISLKIPSKTNSGQKFRLAGQGLKQNGKVGDMIAVVHIEIPSTLSDDEIKLYEKLKKMSAHNVRENLLNE